MVEKGLGRVEEFNEAAASVVRRKELMCCVMVDGVEEHAAGFPKGVAVKKDMGHCPWGIAVRTQSIIAGGGVK